MLTNNLTLGKHMVMVAKALVMILVLFVYSCYERAWSAEINTIQIHLLLAIWSANHHKGSVS